MKTKEKSTTHRNSFKPERFVPLKPTAEEALRRAFTDPVKRLIYYNTCNSLFENNKMRIIHNAITISVIEEVGELMKRFSITLEAIYPTVVRVFNPHEPGLKLSELIDLSSVSAFVHSVSIIEKKFLIDKAPKSNPETVSISAIGTLPLFETNKKEDMYKWYRVNVTSVNRDKAYKVVLCIGNAEHVLDAHVTEIITSLNRQHT